jgi:diguanylate cyclase (GGDEF)-like protein
VKRMLPFLRVRNISELAAPPNNRASGKTGLTERSFVQPNVRRMRGEKRPTSADSLTDMLSSAILVQDKELAGILREVDDLLKTIKSENPETQAFGSALQRTILCALKQSLLDKELRSLALTDDLTGLYNRRAFLALATQQVKAVRRTGRGLLLFYADVDKLKLINDSYGHRLGDFVLVKAAEVLERTFRDSDVIARLGGDEFAALALEVSRSDQDVILRRLRKNLEESRSEDSRYQLSFSVGVARLDSKCSVTIGELMEQADAAMYQEKRKKKRAIKVM